MEQLDELKQSAIDAVLSADSVPDDTPMELLDEIADFYWASWWVLQSGFLRVLTQCDSCQRISTVCHSVFMELCLKEYIGNDLYLSVEEIRVLCHSCRRRIYTPLELSRSITRIDYTPFPWFGVVLSMRVKRISETPLPKARNFEEVMLEFRAVVGAIISRSHATNMRDFIAGL